RVIGAARCSSEALGITSIGGAKTLQCLGHTVGPVRRAISQHIGAAERLHQQTGVEQREEIDDTGLLVQTAAQKMGGTRTDGRRQRIEYGEAAQREAAVIQIGAALSP